MKQHTKGPWIAVNHGPSTPPKEPWLTKADWFTVRDSRNIHIVTVEPFDGAVRDDVAANAALIAEAPALLASLKEMVQDYTDMRAAFLKGKHEDTPAIKRAKATIAKAEED